MPDATPPNGQFEFLNALRKGRATVTLYLVNGIRLQGRIASFDRYAVLLQSRDGNVLIQNHAISTIGRDTGGPRRPRDAEARSARPPRDAAPGMARGGVTRQGTASPDESDVLAAAIPPGHPEARRPAPTVTIVRKGLRRVRTPIDEEPPS